EKTYNASEFLPRICGLICGTDLKISCTYAPFNEVKEIPYETKQATNSRIANGEFVMFKEFGKIKVGRGITSLTTTSQVKGDLFQKVKVVDTMDLISNDLRGTIRDNYIGKYANSYENKCVLIGAVRGYLDGLYLDGLIDKGYEVVIDIDSQKAYLKSIGVKVEELNEQQIKEYNTKDKVFLQINVKILDAIEDVVINVIM
ncbi:phage tail sheath C-terminal domain-containing protein, partial [Clostridium sp.]|uniref:phage tail sheath C-terminal domain-containing protein n=1 Tax=Clostridium sp. TaxID=1506 RepID=UPI003F391857